MAILLKRSSPPFDCPFDLHYTAIRTELSRYCNLRLSSKIFNMLLDGLTVVSLYFKAHAGRAHMQSRSPREQRVCPTRKHLRNPRVTRREARANLIAFRERPSFLCVCVTILFLHLSASDCQWKHRVLEDTEDIRYDVGGSSAHSAQPTMRTAGISLR